MPLRLRASQISPLTNWTSGGRTMINANLPMPGAGHKAIAQSLTVAHGCERVALVLVIASCISREASAS
jgi:hypothetical protein